ncbi:MAG: ferritin-like domain-containing protein [Desulfurococcales archaeon]|nr:ferritin-like domain-containing protein [Desulfurococcales archaeon]MEB3789020.1 ferritin-like domain-containing protein [Desulfurococcales archaeon]
MSSTKEIMNIAKKMIVEEEKYATELENLAHSISHPVLRAIIEGIARDSFKHSLLYEAIVNTIEGKSPFLSDEELELLKKGIRKHIEMEAEMVRLTKELADKTSDPRLKLLLMAIHEDEAKHHALLVDIEKNIAEKEALKEEDVWELVWKDSPWHGSPGG